MRRVTLVYTLAICMLAPWPAVGQSRDPCGSPTPLMNYALCVMDYARGLERKITKLEETVDKLQYRLNILENTADSSYVKYNEKLAVDFVGDPSRCLRGNKGREDVHNDSSCAADKTDPEKQWTLQRAP
ncbi:MAG: hypothetical protein ACLPIX_14345 [Rhodomicrobium sp.]